MICSMTGFGRAELSANGVQCGVELRSVNNRFLEIRFKLPNGLHHLEEEFKNLVKSRCERGKIDCTVILSTQNPEEGAMVLNKPLLHQYAELLKTFKEVLGTEVQVTLGNLITLKDLLQTDQWADESGRLEPLVKDTIAKAVDDLVTMREREGGALQLDMQERVRNVTGLLEEIIPLTRDIPDLFAQRLRDNLTRLMTGPSTHEERIHQEIALLADRYDVSEEITRFRTHLEHLEQLLEEGGPLGRKVDFLLQEVNREANTLASKCNHVKVSSLVVEIKSDLEKLREQIQNIE